VRQAALLAVLLAPSGALAHIILPGTQPFEAGASFAPNSSCDPCHSDYDDAGDYEAGDGARGSSMSHAARNPLFRAALASAEADSPGIGDFCLRCHAPAAFLEGRAVVPDGSLLRETDRGVDCSFCHRMVDGDPEGPYVANGMFFVDDAAVYGGPFDDALDTGHAVGASTYLSDPKACAVCHDQSSVLHGMRDPKGDVIYAQFPNDRTWSEWEASDFAAEETTCQDCHMPEVPGRAASDPDAPDRTVHRHEWNAADVLSADLLPLTDTLAPEVVDALEMGRTRARESLRSAATLEVRTGEVAAGEDEVEVVVRVTNEAGHKLPTGFADGRRMWLDVTVADSAGTELFRSGRYDADADDIVFDRNIRTYEARHGIAFIGPSFRTALNDMVVEDTRIPPRGYEPEDGRIDLLPFGRVYGVGDAAVNQDDAGYDLQVPCGVRGPLTVTARLLYQRASPAYVQHLAGTGGDRGAALLDAWEATGRGAPAEMLSVEEAVEVVACPEPPFDPWDGIGPAERRDGGAETPHVDVPGPSPVRVNRMPAGGCSCHLVDSGAGSAFGFCAWLLLLRGRTTRGRECVPSRR